jgi:hypothetical protein
VVVPTSSYHWIHHRQPQPPLLRGRRRSLSDLDTQQCNCPAYRTLADSSIGNMVDSLQRAHLDAQDDADDMSDLHQRLVLANLRQQQSAAQPGAVPHQLGDDSYRPQEEEDTEEEDGDDDP